MVPHKRVFSEIKDKNRLTPELTTGTRRDNSTIKEKNIFLENCVKNQNEEIERLRIDIASMRRDVEDNLETKRTKKANDSLKGQYDVQSKEIEALR